MLRAGLVRLNLLLLILPLLSALAADPNVNVPCETLFQNLVERPLPAKRPVEIHSSLQAAAQTTPARAGASAGTVLIEGVPIQRISPTSKWRAMVVLPENDWADSRGYISGWERNGNNVPPSRAARFNDAAGEVEYAFADGRKIRVSGQVARALEFSFLDAVNPRSPQNTKVVGIHDNPEHIVKLVRQAGAGQLRNPSAYIRLDEISPEGLPLTSVEELYRRFQLSHPNYSPVGEYVSDRSIPLNRILNTWKFRSVKSFGKIADNKTNRIRLGQKVRYTALSGKHYTGTVADERMIDDHFIVSYRNDSGEEKFDLAAILTVEPAN